MLSIEQKISYLVMLAMFSAIMFLGLLPVALPALITFIIVEKLTSLKLAKGRSYPAANIVDKMTPDLSEQTRRIVAISFVSASVAAIMLGGVSMSVSWMIGPEGLQPMMELMHKTITDLKPSLPESVSSKIPADFDVMMANISAFASSHLGGIGAFGAHILKIFFHVIFGIVIGAMLAVSSARKSEPTAWTAPVLERFSTFLAAGGEIMLAQVKIASINAALTGLFLAAVIPLLGYKMPFVILLTIITFVVGLIPVIGNLISNTMITVVAFSVTPALAAICLGYLIVLHKLEYFLNTKIMASQIQSRPWEILVALILAESAFGAPGLIAAPMVYAYIKAELIKLNVIKG